jgi:hypothetical protein
LYIPGIDYIFHTVKNLTGIHNKFSERMKTKKLFSFVSVFLVIASVAFLSGCGTTKMAIKKYAGSWEYQMETPEGAYKGAIIIAHDGEKFTGRIEADQGSLDLEDLKIEEGKLTAHFSFGSYLIEISGEFKEDDFTGTIGPPEYQMPFSAKRVK